MRNATPVAVLLSLSLALAACKKGGDSQGAPSAGSGSAATSSAAAAPAADTLTVTVAPLVVGGKSEEKAMDDLKFKINVDLAPKPAVEVNQEEINNSVTKTEILATDGKLITKARVSYVSEKKTKTKDGKDQPQTANPRVGKTYVLELKDGKLVITDEKGKKVAKKEDAAVRKDSSRFGQPDPMTTGMPTAPIKVGDAVPGLASALEQYFKDHDSAKDGKNAAAVSGAEVKLASVENAGPDAVGVFSVSLTVGSPKDSKEFITVQMPLQGTVRIRARDGRVMAIKLGGPMTMASTDPKVKLSGAGDFKLAAEMSY